MSRFKIVNALSRERGERSASSDDRNIDMNVWSKKIEKGCWMEMTSYDTPTMLRIGAAIRHGG